MPTKKGRKCLFILSYANPLTIRNFLNQVMKILAPVRLHKRVQWLTKCVVPTHPRIAITLCALVWTKAERNGRWIIPCRRAQPMLRSASAEQKIEKKLTFDFFMPHIKYIWKEKTFLCEACYALNSRQAPNHLWKGNPGIDIFRSQKLFFKKSLQTKAERIPVILWCPH